MALTYRNIVVIEGKEVELETLPEKKESGLLENGIGQPQGN